jgi:glycosyltransferase involved in cell wall biosynthesis
MRIINIIDNITKVNFGIWNAAISTASILSSKYGIATELWFPEVAQPPHLDGVTMVPLKSTQTSYLDQITAERKYDPANTIVITHGCWRYPTLWGSRLKKIGFRWVYVPHGMLEPWSMTQKKWKKKIYFALREKPLSMEADAIRAVGSPEYSNLSSIWSKGNVQLIPNGIETEQIPVQPKNWADSAINYLFMARLHHKKAIIPLVEAWIKSSQRHNSNATLNIAGPDDGELVQLQSIITANPGINVHYLGAVYGTEKEALLRKSHVYLLPSQSEGFPTSVLEAMAYGLVTVISPGCNFPEAFAAKTTIPVNPDIESIRQALESIATAPVGELQSLSEKASVWIREKYSLEIIAEQQARLYKDLLSISH